MQFKFLAKTLFESHIQLYFKLDAIGRWYNERLAIMAEEAKMSTGTMGWNTINSILGGGALATALGVGIPALVKANDAEDKARHSHGRGGCCSENTPVTRFEMEQSQRIALLEADKYTDQKIIEAYKQSVADNKALEAQIVALTEKNNLAHETIYKELVAQREAQLISNAKFDKDIALGRQADFYQNQLNECRYYKTKKVVAKDDICPGVMPEFNSWTAPTTTDTATGA